MRPRSIGAPVLAAALLCTASSRADGPAAMRSPFLRQWTERVSAPGADTSAFWNAVAGRASLVGNAISQSGGYALGDPKGPRPGARDPYEGVSEDDFPQQEWLARQIATSPARPIRLHLEVGTLEHVDRENAFPRYATPSVLLASRHLRDVLDAKGYAFSYREYNGPHDSLVWRGAVGDAIVELLGAGR
jgi:hypothetical protein